MEVFKLIVDELVQGWRRSYVDVEADSLEEAIEMIREDSIEAGIDDFPCTEFLCDTEVLVPRSEDDPCTLEIMDRDWDLLYCNRDEPFS